MSGWSHHDVTVIGNAPLFGEAGRTVGGTVQFHWRDETGRYGESLFPLIRGVHVLGQNIQLSAIGEFERARRIEHVEYRPPRQMQSP